MKNKVKGDNRGFTLVEIVVTIMVLAIITVPLLSYFTDSVRHSARTKQQENAVVLAQNTLEELKTSGQDLSDPNRVLATASPTPTINPSATPGTSATPSASPQATLLPWKELAAQPLPTPVGSFYPSYYLYRNISENNRSYLVQIKVTPKHDLERTDPADTTKKLTETYESVKLPELNSSTDVILQEDTTPFNEAVRQFYTKHKNQGGHDSRNDIAQKVERSIRLTFQEDPKEANNINVVIYYNYHCTGTTYGLVGGDTYYQVPVKSASIPAKDLRNVFIFFKPSDKGDSLQFGPTGADPNTEGSLSFTNLQAKGLKQGQVRLYLIAQGSVPHGEGDGTVPERLDSYQFTVGSAATNGITNVFANTAPANSEKSIFTNLAGKEISATASDLIYLFAGKRDATTGKMTSTTLVEKEETDRIAEVEVSVYRDMGDGEATMADEKKRLAVATGTVVLNK